MTSNGQLSVESISVICKTIELFSRLLSFSDVDVEIRKNVASIVVSLMVHTLKDPRLATDVMPSLLVAFRYSILVLGDQSDGLLIRTALSSFLRQLQECHDTLDDAKNVAVVKNTLLAIVLILTLYPSAYGLQTLTVLSSLLPVLYTSAKSLEVCLSS